MPTTKKEVEILGWNELDVILFTGDAYVDHPSFGAAVIGRIIENEGLKIAIVPQPNWRDDLRDFKKLGIPKLFFAVTAGNMDSLVNHYTANKRLRSTDAYTPGNKAGYRPDYATIVYTTILKKLYPEVPVIIGGIEASLRRFTHYDYWSDSLKPSILFESKADLLVYGMGEKPIKVIINELKQGKKIEQLKNVLQTAYFSPNLPRSAESLILHSHNECLKDKIKYAENFKTIETESNKWKGSKLIQKINGKFIIVNPQNKPLTEKELDSIYQLPFTYLSHPKYSNKDSIPAYEMIKFSVNVHRGCFGGCSFCTISTHQGKFISSRSERSILQEIEKIKSIPGFKGHITDLGGPSANMYKMEGIDLQICKKCSRPSCIYPSICKNLNIDHSKLTSLYQKAKNSNNITKVSIGSGLRYDMIYGNIQEKYKKAAIEYIHHLIKHNVSGRLKVAPEHTEDSILKLIRKPEFELFSQLQHDFNKLNVVEKRNQQILPYFISNLPGCDTKDMSQLAVKIKNHKLNPDQVQDFTPTPMTLSTVMYYSGINPYTGERIQSEKSLNNRKVQKMFFFWYLKENKPIIIQQLKKLGLSRLIHTLYPKSNY